jgi:hypothetical protein
MEMTGHKTCAVFKRYTIVDEGMLREAGANLSAAAIFQRETIGVASGKVAAIKCWREELTSRMRKPTPDEVDEDLSESFASLFDKNSHEWA